MADDAYTTVREASMTDNGFGLEPADSGWFIVNVADAAGWRSDTFGTGVSFESRASRFEHYGVNIQVLEPGQPNCRYHNEPAQESFLVLRGECVLVVEEQERSLRAGDFVHCAPMVRHVFIGRGDGPCAILMIGARLPEDGGGYPISEVADKYGASTATATDDPAVPMWMIPRIRESALTLGGCL